VHSATPILPSCNYCGNPAHKASECNIPSEDLFCDYCGKKGHQEAVCFAKFPERKQLRLQRQNLPASSAVPQPKAKAPQLSTQALPTKGNSNKNAKKKEQNADKREVLQAYATQVQTLQNELESLRAQLANLKGKSSQPASHAQPVQVQDHTKDLLGHSMAFHTMPWLGSMFFPLHTILIHNHP
jgi:hypothetical protein